MFIPGRKDSNLRFDGSVQSSGSTDQSLHVGKLSHSYDFKDFLFLTTVMLMVWPCGLNPAWCQENSLSHLYTTSEKPMPGINTQSERKPVQYEACRWMFGEKLQPLVSVAIVTSLENFSQHSEAICSTWFVNLVLHFPSNQPWDVCHCYSFENHRFPF